MIRQLNRDELARVQKRDANYAQGWRAYRDSGASGSDAREYANARADYQRQMADWRYAVAACRDGRVEYCR